TEHLSNKEEVFSLKAFAEADEKYRLPVEVINEYAWHNLFARQLFITPTEEEYEEHDPVFTILSAPTCIVDPSVDGTGSESFVVISFNDRIILIGFTAY